MMRLIRLYILRVMIYGVIFSHLWSDFSPV